MKLDFIDEPELEFGGLRRHVDIREGLRLFGPLDKSDGAPRRIRAGIVGTQLTIDNLRQWFERCREGIAAKASKQPNLFPAFPGFGDDSPFRTDFNFDAALCRVLPPRELRALAQKSHYRALVDGVELVAGEVRAITEHGRPDVVLVALPPELVGLDEDEEEDPDAKGPDSDANARRSPEEDELAFGTDLDLRNMLKAEVMKFGQPIQIALPSTYDSAAKVKSGGTDGKGRLQDEATRAWNIHTALYYKANYRPWRITRNSSDLKTCFVGVSFYRSLDKANLMTSMAQVYDERGEGVIVRGKPVQLFKDDPTPHLSSEDAFALIVHALKEYRREHKHAPARLVLHKSSNYNTAELEGFNRAIEDQELDAADFLVVSRASAKLFREDRYPPLRGTLLSLDDRNHLLYTRGSVPYYATYPGMYVPRPLKFQIAQGNESPRKLAEEMLALTKLNWNNTQFDGGMPITMRVARDVGRVLKYVGAGGVVQPKYSFYM
jgi:antitoxin (DNA-binding transcriptional repressor) of toxin-antitoxin stability system